MPLRDTAKPMGVAEYVLSGALPAQLRDELPTLEELAREFPYLSLVKLRIEIEQALRSLMSLHGLPAQRPMGLGNMLRELDRHNVRIPATEGFLKAMSPMNAAAHGIDVSVDDAQAAEKIGAEFLAQIRNLEGA